MKSGASDERCAVNRVTPFDTTEGVSYLSLCRCVHSQKAMLSKNARAQARCQSDGGGSGATAGVSVCCANRGSFSFARDPNWRNRETNYSLCAWSLLCSGDLPLAFAMRYCSPIVLAFWECAFLMDLSRGKSGQFDRAGFPSSL